MLRECPKTCKLCVIEKSIRLDNVTTSSDMITTPICYENDSHKCKSLKNFCKNFAYQPIMRKECPITCGICKLFKSGRKKNMTISKKKNEELENKVDNFFNYYDHYY